MERSTEGKSTQYLWVAPIWDQCSPCCWWHMHCRSTLVITANQKNSDSVEKSFYLTTIPGGEALQFPGHFKLWLWVSNNLSVISHLPTDTRSTRNDLWINHGQTDSLQGLHHWLTSQYDPVGYIVPFTTLKIQEVPYLWSIKTAINTT